MKTTTWARHLELSKKRILSTGIMKAAMMTTIRLGVTVVVAETEAAMAAALVAMPVATLVVTAVAKGGRQKLTKSSSKSGKNGGRGGGRSRGSSGGCGCGCTGPKSGPPPTKLGDHYSTRPGNYFVRTLAGRRVLVPSLGLASIACICLIFLALHCPPTFWSCLPPRP